MSKNNIFVCIPAVRWTSPEGIKWQRIPRNKPHKASYMMYYITSKGVPFSFNTRTGKWREHFTDIKGKNNPYQYINLGQAKYPERYYIHDLVARYFVPKRHMFCNQIHHIDGNRLNNDFNNLIHLTTKEHARIHAEARRRCYETLMKVLAEERVQFPWFRRELTVDN